MRVLMSWLKEYIPQLAASAEDIAKRLTSGGIEVDSIEPIDGSNDVVIDLDLTPNRSDCLSMFGVAQEIAAIYDLPMQIPNIPELPLRVDSSVLSITATEQCPYYLALIIDNVQVGESPRWLQDRLNAAGMRSINNIVDLSNFVMLEIGEPLHSFDYGQLQGQRIEVRLGKYGEQIRTLDNQLRTIDETTLLICDAEAPVAIAGVMGNDTSEVQNTTTRLLIEAACFERRSIRRTSKKQGLPSEAAIRFEKGVDPASLRMALQRFAQLITELGIGTVQQEIISASEYAPQATHAIYLRRRRLHMLSGLQPTDNEIEAILQRLGFSLETGSEGDGWKVTVPTRRQDLNEEVDLIEEVARLVGFEDLPALLPEGSTTLGAYTPEQRALRLIRRTLIENGLHEIINYSFLDPDCKPHQWMAEQNALVPLIPLLNPLSSIYGAMRSSLLPGMLQTILYNLSHQNRDLQLFEMGAVFMPKEMPIQQQPHEQQSLIIALCGGDHQPSWDRAVQELDFFSMKGILERLSAALHTPILLQELSGNPAYHPYRAAAIVAGEQVIGSMGELHPDLLAYCDVDKRVIVMELNLDALLPIVSFLPKVSSIPRYPSSRRDFALLVEKSLPSAEVQRLIVEAGGTLLEQVYLFDDYRGSQVPAGHKSLAFTLVYRASDRTLTDAEVTEQHKLILARVESDLGARQRE